MKVEIVEGTPNPEEVVCKSARNDYLSTWIGDMSFEDIMEHVDGDSIEEKKENMVVHLMRRGHFGPFEHPNVTFTVGGISRITMAQITRHRHASFDVQSLRYTEPTIGVTVDDEILSLKPRRTGGVHGSGSLDPRQIEEVREWISDGFPPRYAEALFGEGVLDDVEAVDRDNGSSVSSELSPVGSGAEALGFVSSLSSLDGIEVLDVDATESKYMKEVSRYLPGSRVVSVDGDVVSLVFDSDELGISDSGDGVGGMVESMDESRVQDFCRGVFSALGGVVDGDAVLYDLSTDADQWGSVLNYLDLEEREDGGYKVDEASLEDMYRPELDISRLHKTRLMQVMDVNTDIEHWFRDEVVNWLDENQYIYPPSVREDEILSREAGRIEFESPPWVRIDEVRRAYLRQSESYNRLRAMGVPAEDARAVLGMGIKINMTFSLNARALMHIFDMRGAGDAQWEVRWLTDHLLECAKKWMPTTFSYYEEEMMGRKNRLGP